jgi:hypothetical protein
MAAVRWAMGTSPAPVYDGCTMTPWLTLEQALGARGLRVAPVRAGLPSPWSEFVRACFHVKRIPYSLVDFAAAMPNCPMILSSGPRS